MLRLCRFCASPVHCMMMSKCDETTFCFLSKRRTCQDIVIMDPSPTRHMGLHGTIFSHMKHILSSGIPGILFNKNKIQCMFRFSVFHKCFFVLHINRQKQEVLYAVLLLFVVLNCAFLRAELQDLLPVGEVDGVNASFFAAVGGHEEAGVGFFVAFPGKAPHIGVDQVVADFLDG